VGVVPELLGRWPERGRANGLTYIVKRIDLPIRCTQNLPATATSASEMKLIVVLTHLKTSIKWSLLNLYTIAHRT